MGPTNVALVKLFQADSKLREAQQRLDTATRNVRSQTSKVGALAERSSTLAADLLKARARAAELELEIRTRDERIEQMREQQQQAQTSREYQAFLVQINTNKVDKAAFEEELLEVMQQTETLTAEQKTVGEQHVNEDASLVKMKSEIDQRVQMLGGEVERLRPAREEAAADVPVTALVIFDRLAEKFDGEAMAPIEKPHPKREEYICSVCNLDLTLDVYNRLHSRDEPLMCPSGNHLLYIPDDLPPEKAVHKPKEKKAPVREKKPRKIKPKPSDIAAPVARQTLATSVVPSIDEEQDASQDLAATPDKTADDASTTAERVVSDKPSDAIPTLNVPIVGEADSAAELKSGSVIGGTMELPEGTSEEQLATANTVGVGSEVESSHQPEQSDADEK